MRILLAGGAGFIGSHLARNLLTNGHRVVIVDNCSSGRLENLARIARELPGAPFEMIHLDVCQLRDLPGHFDGVLNLASAASPVDYLAHPIETLEAGSVGTHNLLGIALRDGARFLMASTSEVYGDPEVHPQPETYWGSVNPVGPRSVYDEAKRFSEALCSAFARKYGLAVRIARIFNTYGPHMRLDDGRVIPTLLGQALQGVPLTVQGDGLQTRSYCYVDDLVDGLVRLLESEVEGPVNLGNPEEYTVLDTARAILDIAESSSVITFRPRPEDDPHRRRPDISRARSLLAWEPRTHLRDGLERTCRDIRSQLECRALTQFARRPSRLAGSTAERPGTIRVT